MGKLDEIKGYKEGTEKQIAGLLREFERVTGMTVSDITIFQSLSKCPEEYGLVERVEFVFDWSKLNNG